MLSIQIAGIDDMNQKVWHACFLSKVDLKTDTNSVGKSWIKPIRIVKVTCRLPSQMDALVVKNQVANE